MLIASNPNFYPRSPCGERLHPLKAGKHDLDFYPRSPCGERLSSHRICLPLREFLSTLSLRRATSGHLYGSVPIVISIHALLAESDSYATGKHKCLPYFYPRSPCGERRCPDTAPRANSYFYPRSPCGERRGHGQVQCTGKRFLSTLSLRRATVLIPRYRNSIHISIHALLAESDIKLLIKSIPPFNFYPRSPCGERPHALCPHFRCR